MDSAFAKSTMTFGYLSALSDIQSWILRSGSSLDVRTLRALNAEICRLNDQRHAETKATRKDAAA